MTNDENNNKMNNGNLKSILMSNKVRSSKDFVINVFRVKNGTSGSFTKY